MATIIEIKVPLHCSECINKVSKALAPVKGVTKIVIEDEKDKITVTGDGLKTTELLMVVEKAIGKSGEHWRRDAQEWRYSEHYKIEDAGPYRIIFTPDPLPGLDVDRCNIL